MIFGVDSRNRKCADKFEERKARLLSKVKLDESVKKLLYEIRSLGMSIAITSNNFQELIDNFIARESGFFDLVLGFGNGLSKGPSQFTRVMDTFGVDRRYLIFVGDSLSDARRALAFGIDFVAVSGTLKKESFTSIFPSIYVIDELTELYYLLLSKMPLIQDKGPL
jgi:phosphoglycolate phosphatase-like HAD superfamily hydrolase